MATNTKNLEMARHKLSANNLESGLPGREFHSDELYTFIYERLKIRQTASAKRAKVESGEVADIKGRHMSKTMFVCGVPGTGKTATVFSVIHRLGKLLNLKNPPIYPFEHVYVNGQHLSAPERVYTEILYKLSGETCQPEKAMDRLEKIFGLDDSKSENLKKSSKTKVSNSFKVIIIDELDLLYNERRQSVFYSLFDWPTSTESKLVLVTIANAMDLPERFMRGRISSRLGWNKLVFESYTSDCLQTILKARLGQELLDKCFDKAAIIVATKRIGRTTGDARRILDTCRLAIDRAIQENLPKVTANIIDKVGFQNLDTQRAEYICECPPLQLMTLKCIIIESARVGEVNVDGLGVYRQLINMASKDDYFKTHTVGYGEFQAILNDLAGVSMIYLEGEKPLLKKRLFIKNSSESIRDLIKTQRITV